MIITIASSKRGVSKTTTAVHLAGLSSRPTAHASDLMEIPIEVRRAGHGAAK